MSTNDIEKQESTSKRTIQVDRIFSRKDYQWHFVKSKPPSKEDRFKKYALVVRRTILFDGTPGKTFVELRSSHLAKVFRSILKGVECNGLRLKPPTFKVEILFLVAPLLNAHLAEEEDRGVLDLQTSDDIKEVLTFVDSYYGPKKQEIESFHANGEIIYEYLWTLFPPGCEVLQRLGLKNESQALKFIKYYLIRASMINHNGDKLGWGVVKLKIPIFSQAKPITSLPVFPLKFCLHGSKVQRDLKERGKRYLDYSKPTCREYDGIGVEMKLEGDNWKEKRFYTSGRVMIDPITFKMNCPDSELLELDIAEEIESDNVTDDDLIFCNHRALGFSFATKTWGGFAVSKLQEVTWDITAIDKLIIDGKRRHIITSLIKGHKSDQSKFDDIVQGKGKGLVGLFSGPPRTGKTLTAEVVAEMSKRALYTVTVSELGTEAKGLDESLDRIMSTARRWGCVVLIDEADIFLRKRKDDDKGQNALVSVFLRRLEYFHGIIILTTNRLKDMDDAFRSRIHFKFHYPPLTHSDRVGIWRNFLPGFTEADLNTLAPIEINGREIKNAVACTTTICGVIEEPLSVGALKDSLETYAGWEESQE
ncbi:P-loop containing nucleoside triphosphate hydrolase protein [Hypoxylon trugodes]|uniref:P-loop containing nucleoside triphosphate hydrolase protein n=1 Tax=Hypoxylon trugodes TaxID=326681 RepID=UPI0021957B01|nr:P-loop containing nucleoside triphosphate hydrolase protein [Hypoxylon trugodes]KAI1387720.1 P-loop containing nucleoside triphosphate hydrolase protein [Hypoxylon trugodes]